MKFYEVAPTRIVRSGAAVFTYHSKDALTVGQLVMIPVGKQLLTGLVIREVAQPTYDTKTVGDIIDPTPVPSGVIALALWMSDYYATPLATVLQTILPRGLTVKRRKTVPAAPVSADVCGGILQSCGGMSEVSAERHGDSSDDR